MIEFHAVMVDETGCEFGATIRAASRNEAWDKAREDYPESRCVQLESPEDTAKREKRTYDFVAEFDDWEEEE